ncbi:MAG: recombinase family protein [Phycisphaeraceae bacterium]|nr:recombinase family protein [Phycisphaeraceae bacterium]
MKTVRCAIYTRKSNEEGLDQAFNSLDAQREAGLDYIRSQKHEGWKAVAKRYDDGGFSGGTMKRPALGRLLDDIDKGRIDVAVVYKVDRLSRSLNDFAQMMRLFDERQVSFVSVTQQFNTTTSMGRLTLNMLLSFAQFEREVAGERIRDKIAATKKKGYWVCGQPPLGYRLQREDEPRGLYIIPDEAELVREIFRRFIETKSQVAVVEALNEAGHTTKRWTSSTGRVHGGKPLTRKYVYKLLTNPTYIGKITHTRNGEAEVYDGRHEPIIPQAVWDEAHRLMTTQERDRLHRWTHPHLLKGKLRTHEDFAMSPTSTHRPLTKRGASNPGNRQKRLVRYYISQKALRRGFKACPIKSVNAEHLDDLVRGVVLDHLDFDGLAQQPAETRDRWIRAVIDGVVLSPDALLIKLDAGKIAEIQNRDFGPLPAEPASHPTCPHCPEIEDRGRCIHLTLRIQIKKLDGRRLLLSPDGHDLVIPSSPEPRQHIVDAIGLAYRWREDLLQTGLSTRAYSATNGVARARLVKLLPLTQLGPDILKHALVGTLPGRITLNDLLIAAKQLDWERQAAELGIDAMPRAAGR